VPLSEQHTRWQYYRNQDHRCGASVVWNGV